MFRNESEDSRYASMGNIQRKSIVGKVIFKADPLSLVGGPK